MARAKARTISHQVEVSSYEKLVRRVNQVISSPRAQLEKQACLAPGPSDLPEDWERLLDEIQETENVSMTRQDDGSIHLRWRCPEQ